MQELATAPHQPVFEYTFLEGGGEMGERILNFNWDKTSLGPPQNWSQSLKSLAIKYSPSSDKIDVTIHRPRKNNVSVSVKDYGIGVDKENQDKIFERFYRAEGESEQTYPGFGIGLFIAKEIIQRHNGSISLTSEKGKGSVFTFTLPVRPTTHNQ
jgi:signal transduction histidine kinase